VGNSVISKRLANFCGWSQLAADRDEPVNGQKDEDCAFPRFS